MSCVSKRISYFIVEQDSPVVIVVGVADCDRTRSLIANLNCHTPAKRKDKADCIVGETVDSVERVGAAKMAIEMVVIADKDFEHKVAAMIDEDVMGRDIEHLLAVVLIEVLHWTVDYCTDKHLYLTDSWYFAHFHDTTRTGLLDLAFVHSLQRWDTC